MAAPTEEMAALAVADGQPMKEKKPKEKKEKKEKKPKEENKTKPGK
jgi:hypothetical protein